MARYETTISSTLSPSDAFAYMAEFSNAVDWDPSVSSATREGDAAPAPGTAFDLVARFGGRSVKLRYVIVDYTPPERVTLEAKQSTFTSRDTITVQAAGDGSTVHYDAALDFRGVSRLLDPVMQRLFKRLGDNAADGLRRALNP